jgi:hypothetical protein
MRSQVLFSRAAMCLAVAGCGSEFAVLPPRGSVTAVIDGATHSLTTSTTTGTGGANACEAGHTGGWTNMTSTRAAARQCGTITVSDHFAA